MKKVFAFIFLCMFLNMTKSYSQDFSKQIIGNWKVYSGIDILHTESVRNKIPDAGEINSPFEIKFDANGQFIYGYGFFTNRNEEQVKRHSLHEVIFNGFNGKWTISGNILKILHPNGLTTLYSIDELNNNRLEICSLNSNNSFNLTRYKDERKKSEEDYGIKSICFKEYGGFDRNGGVSYTVCIQDDLKGRLKFMINNEYQEVDILFEKNIFFDLTKLVSELDSKHVNEYPSVESGGYVSGIYFKLKDGKTDEIMFFSYPPSLYHILKPLRFMGDLGNR